MVVENDLIGLRQRRLCCLNLLDQVNAITVFFDHCDDAIHMPGNTFEAVNEGCLFMLFHSSPLYPLPGGVGIGSVYHLWATRQHLNHYGDGSEMQSPIPLTDTLPSNSWIVHSSTLYINTALFADPNWEIRCNSPI